MNFPLPQPHTSIASEEEALLLYWKENNIFEKTISYRRPTKPFRFFDGPPFATGTPHYGHILTGTLKDAIPRYKTMQGYQVHRKWGWDCHGVPVEFQVEKEHRIGGKPGIEKMGIGNFNELCRSVVLRCRDQWEATVERMGRFVDFKNDYKTMDKSFMESVWWVFTELYNKGLIYEGEKVVAYSPKLGSPLSNFEAGLQYKDLDDPTLTVKFEILAPSLKKLKKAEETVYFLAWTTTPWTLPSNLALGVHPDIQYVKTKAVEGKSYIVAEKLLEKIFKEKMEIDQKIDGKSLIGSTYKPLFPWFKDHISAFRVIPGDFISDEDGTGIVHIAPNFGEDDALICEQNHIHPLQNPIDENGYFDGSIRELKGLYFRYDPIVGEETKEKNANDWVIQDLKKRELLFHRSQMRHSYPHCWRTDCALMYRGIKTWFVDIQKIKSQLLEKNKTIDWIPSHLKYGRFGKGLESAPDWAISRNRYWGTPIPIWKCDKTGKLECIGSCKELEEKTGQKIKDIHRHFIDPLTWENPETGGTMRRIPEVLDCWFESGSMPYASIHYPFENGPRKIFRNQFYLMRHAESENNVLKIGTCQGEKEKKYGLTKKGQKQVQEKVALGYDFDVIISSPLRRTRETAEYFAQAKGVKVLLDDRIRESGLGDLDGEKYEVFEKFAQTNDILHTPYPGGESVKDIEKRVAEFLEDIDQKYKNQKVLVISHGLPLQLMISWSQGKKAHWWKGEIKNAEIIDLNKKTHSDFVPADFIAEGLDQTRCWFYNLHVLGVALLGEKVYKNVITSGIVLSEDGTKMSKSKKNYPDPAHIFDRYGADAMRFYLMSSPVARGENLRFSEQGVAEVLKSVILPLKSAYQFFATYAHIDEWTPTKFIFVRHGESDHNIDHIYSGEKENKHTLTEKGKKQVHEVVAHLGNFDALYTSPFERTKKTAEMIKKESSFSGEIKEDERIREISFGDLEGQPLIPPLERIANPSTEHPHNVQKRMKDFFEEIQKKQVGKTIVCVTHSGCIRELEAALNDIYEVSQIIDIPGPLTGKSRVFFPLPQSQNELDQWIFSELQTLIDQFQKSFDAYQLDLALRLIPEFIDKMNNWYLRRSRRRFWGQGMDEDKKNGYQTLHYVLYQLSKIIAPVCPFLAEKMYRDLGGGESVHLEFFPRPLVARIQKNIEQKVALSREIVSLAAGIRARKKIKLRQPLAKLQFLAPQKQDLDLDIIREEANVKEVEILSSVEGTAQKIVRVNAKKVGPRLGKKVQEIIKKGKEGDFKKVKEGIMIGDEILSPEEYEFGFLCHEDKEAEASEKVVVILDTKITPELETEGYARELIRAIQELRKQKDFAVCDHITLRFMTRSAKLKKAFQDYGKEIARETLCDSLIDAGEITPEIDPDTMILADEKVFLQISKN